jgi:PAS domain S-box-containing protein
MGLSKLFKGRSNESDPVKGCDDGKPDKAMWLQKSLQEIQVRYRKLLNHTQAIQYTHDLQGQFLSVDPEITEFLGYDRNSLLKMNICTILPSEVRHQFETYLGEIKRQGVAKGLMVVQTASGEKRILKYYNTLRTEDVTIPFVQGIAYDITEQKQTRRTLKQLSEQLSVILESLPIVCYICKAEADYGATYITHNVKAITGFEQTDFTSKPSFWADRIHPEDAPRIFADLPQIIEKGYREHQYRWQVADGSYRWFYDYTRFMKSSDGQHYIIGMMQDITERKRADEALKKEKDKAQTYLDVAGVLLVAINTEQKVTLINKRGCEILGYAQEEVLGKNWFDHFVPERMRKEVKTVFSNLVAGETEPVEYFENKVLTKSGEERIIAWHNTVIGDENGHVAGTLSSGEDITDTKRAQEALLTAAQQWRTTFDGISDIVCLLDPEGKILKCNRALTRFSGKSFRDILHRPYWEIIHGASAPVKESPVELMKETCRREIAVLPIGDRWFNVAVDPLLDETGAFVGAVHIMSDITERRRAVERVERLSKENAIMAEIGRIIGSSINIDEVYERFSQEVDKLIPFDRIEIVTINPQDYTITIAYITGIGIAERGAGDTFPMTGSVVEEIVRTRSGLLIQSQNIEEFATRFPRLTSSFQAGLRSMIFVPLISEDQVIGVLTLRTTRLDAYAEKDLTLAQRVGNQIAGAIANARLFTERKQAEEEARRNEENLQTLMDASPMAISWADMNGNIEYNNCKFRELFGYTVGDIPTIAEWRRRAYPNPAYRETIPSLLLMLTEAQKQGREPTPLETIITCKDGSRRHVEQTGAFASNRILAIYKDITERKRAEEALKKSEEEAKRLSQENAVMAEIGRILSSTLNIDEVYERFAEEVRKLIHFDRIVINVIDVEKATVTNVYMTGKEIADRKVGETYSLKGSGGAEVVRTKSSFLIQTEDFNEYKDRFPMLLSTFQAGFRSIMSIPLFSKGRVIGGLLLRSLKPYAYTAEDVKLAERVGSEIAGAIANAQLFAERKHAEEAAKRLAKENAIVAEIGRIISSTLNIEEVYERFAGEVGKLIPLDRVSIVSMNPDKRSATITYAWGPEIKDRNRGDVFPLKDTMAEKVIASRSGMLILLENEEALAQTHPALLNPFRAGFRSILWAPLVSEDQAIGVLILQTFKDKAYTESDLKLAEKVGNQIAGAIANAKLYAERKQMEDALRKSEERFRDLYDHAPLGYHEYDAEGHLTNVNRTDLEMLGYTAEEMIGQPIWKFNIEGDAIREHVFAKLAGNIPPGRNLERVYRKKDGTTIPVLVEDRLILDEEGRIKGIRCTIQDITARKGAEEEKESLREQLRQSQKMEAIGKLAGGVAHDFNNLLTVIHGYSELLLNSLDQGSQFRQDVQEIMHASERASSLTRQLLAFSRKQVLQPKVLDLNAHVSNMDKMLRRMIGEDIELVTRLTKDLGRIKADPGQIEQAILNLAVNAKDAMLNGGKLTIETANVRLDETYARSRIGVTPGDYVMLSMSDTGVGMAPETQERIFEPFFTTKERGKGTGLGLSTVYGIVQQSGGNIWVYSEPGLGTTFKIYLPRIEEGSESLRPAAVPTKPLQGSETILLVEDEAMVRKLAYTVLQRNGYKVLEASNGEEALDFVQGRNGNPIHLVVTDVVMPGMSGRQLADRLVSLRPEIKTLYMSGYTDDAIVHHGVLDPGIAYIQKPFTPEALASKVREILDGN